MKKRFLVFDFDGTIANTIGPAMELANGILEDMGEKTLDPEQMESLRDKSYLEIIQAFNVPVWKVPGLLLTLRTSLLEHFEMIKPYPHIIPLLKKLSKEGYYMYILTSNDKEFVQKFLKVFEISVFEDVYSEMNIFGKGDALKKFMKLQNIEKDDIIYIGDEVRDIEACKKNDTTVISITWGFNSENILKEAGPTKIANTPDELHTAISSLSK